MKIRIAGVTSLILGFGASGCGVSDQGSLPPDVRDPASLQNVAGTIARYRGSVVTFAAAFDKAVVVGAILTDELTGLPAPQGRWGNYTALDSRDGVGPFGEIHTTLHNARAQAREARGFWRSYALDTLPALPAHLYTLEAYAEILLADLFCSGIPLSTVDFGGDYTLAAGSATADVYHHALTLLDSARAVLDKTNDAHLRHLTAVGAGRAHLARGEYAAAAAAVADVPDAYIYQDSVDSEIGLQHLMEDFRAGHEQLKYGMLSVADREGGTGMNYLTSGDPRLPLAADTNVATGAISYRPAWYPRTGPIPLTLATGIEARLIEAEAGLRTDGDWLVKLNTLRTDGLFDTQPNAGDPSMTDTLWHAGTGGVADLGLLVDPGNAQAREDLLFRERAFWLYLTGHRLGDVRRLVRPPYDRTRERVYPVGRYGGGGKGVYGDDFVLPVPESEQILNPRYTGCIHRNP